MLAYPFYVYSNTNHLQAVVVLEGLQGASSFLRLFSSSRVFQLTVVRVDKRTGQAVAIKVIDVENAEDEVEDIYKRSLFSPSSTRHTVTQYHGSYLKGSDLWIVMEFCSGGVVGFNEARLMERSIFPSSYENCYLVWTTCMGIRSFIEISKV